MDLLLDSDGVPIAGHVAQPRVAPGAQVPGLLICHGFPTYPNGGRQSARSFPELADRIATELGWKAAVITFRGCGESGGDFSLGGWLDDLLAAVAFLDADPGVDGVWVLGFGTGGGLALCAAAHQPGIRGVVAIGAPADFDDWAGHPRRLLQHAREVGIIHDPRFPPSVDRWSRQLRELRPVACIPDVADRPVLLVHGSEDDVVPVFDARVLADAHGTADLRILEGGGHQLRHDPRAVAVVLGWLDRQRARTAADG